MKKFTFVKMHKVFSPHLRPKTYFFFNLDKESYPATRAVLLQQEGCPALCRTAFLLPLKRFYSDTTLPNISYTTPACSIYILPLRSTLTGCCPATILLLTPLTKDSGKGT